MNFKCAYFDDIKVVSAFNLTLTSKFYKDMSKTIYKVNTTDAV
jgi:hypothetical protein